MLNVAIIIEMLELFLLFFNRNPSEVKSAACQGFKMYERPNKLTQVVRALYGMNIRRCQKKPNRNEKVIGSCGNTFILLHARFALASGATSGYRTKHTRSSSVRPMSFLTRRNKCSGEKGRSHLLTLTLLSYVVCLRNQYVST